MNIFGKNSTSISMPKAKRVHGIDVKKVPVGKYLEAISELEELPGTIIDKLFPDTQFDEVISNLAAIDGKALLTLITRLLIISPQIVVKPLSKILGVNEDMIINTLTPKELKDVIKAYWELNDMSDFFGDVLGLIKAKLPALTTGFSAGLPSQKASGSAKSPS